MAKEVIPQNVIDVRRLLHDRRAEGYPVTCEEVAALSPYLTVTSSSLQTSSETSSVFIIRPTAQRYGGLVIISVTYMAG